MLSRLSQLRTFQAFGAAGDNPHAKLLYIQYLRALAATSVVIGHVFHEMPKFGDAVPVILAPLALENVFYQGGVDLFFVISGFIMMHMSEKYFNAPAAPKAFLVRRVIRIVPAYWFFTCLFLIPALFLPNVLDNATFDLGNFFASLFFIPYASDASTFNGIKSFLPVGWTLNYEMAFYGVFALGLFFSRKIGVVLVVIGITAIIGIAQQLPQSWVAAQFYGHPVFFEFLVGMGAYYAIKSNHRWLFVGLTALAAVLYGKFIGGRLAVGLGSASVFVLAQIVMGNAGRTKSVISRVILMVGEGSYILYLSNLFAIETCSLLIRAVFGPSYFATFLFIVTGTLSAIMFAVLFHYEVDDRLQIWLRKKMIAPQTPVAKEAPAS